MKKIAIVGTGISGLGAAYLLQRENNITVYEKAARIGGHSRTISVAYGDRTIPVDTGFIVFNKPNYPNFSALLKHLNVKVHESDMTFAATVRDGWLEWGAKDASTILAQRRNLFRPQFYRLFRDILRFNARALTTVEAHPTLTLRELIAKLGLGTWFQQHYLLPMGGAIWSCPTHQMLEFPAESFVRFFANHGLLALNGQPQWYTVTGGAQEYVKKLTADFASRIRKDCGAARIARIDGKVRVTDTNGETETYDELVLACHGDEALSLLADPSERETSLLGAFRYQANQAILHKDCSVMPKRRSCWASWVYRSDGHAVEPAISVSYWMNCLQGIDAKYPLFVTLNPTRPIRDEDIFDQHLFMHPVFDRAAIEAQPQIQKLQGTRNTWYAGAHLRHGFHEDGLWSAVQVAKGLGARIPWAEAPAEITEISVVERARRRATGHLRPTLTPAGAAAGA